VPLYEYQCLSCEHRFERLQKFSDPPVSVCPVCGSDKVSQLLSAPAVQFKGSGWYVTDYGRAGAGGGPKSNNSQSGDSAKAEKSEKSEKSESKATETSKPSSSSASGSSEK
jgi:putative FmdB family regulatory protein